MQDPFFFGAATSAHQVEGGQYNDWSEWEEKNAARLANQARALHKKQPFPDFIATGHPNPFEKENYISGRACDQYHLFEKDFDIAKSLGHNAHRFSIEWSRVEPDEGRFDPVEIEHYRTVARALRARGLEPFVTLWHWTLPVWLAAQGGVECVLFKHYFERYTKRMAEALGPDVRFWITVNEPEVYLQNAYIRGIWPPEKNNVISWFAAIRNLITAHRAAYYAIKERFPDAQVGPVNNLVFFEADGGIINRALARTAHFVRDHYFIDNVRLESDFLGLNYYFHSRVYYGFNKNLNKEVSDMGWELYPEGIYWTIMDLWKRYKRPIYITENGLADARDEKRETFLAQCLAYVRHAMKAGADVRGYLHWSLLDNFEWDKGFWPRFGLVAVDYKTMARTIRPSALVYKTIIEQWKNLQL